MGLGRRITGAFSFLFPRSQNEERIAQYVIREHHRGRPLPEILEDHYVTNRFTPEQIKRLLDRPEVVHALGEDLVNETKTELVTAGRRRRRTGGAGPRGSVVVIVPGTGSFDPSRSFSFEAAAPSLPPSAGIGSPPSRFSGTACTSGTTLTSSHPSRA